MFERAHYSWQVSRSEKGWCGWGGGCFRTDLSGSCIFQGSSAGGAEVKRGIKDVYVRSAGEHTHHTPPPHHPLKTTPRAFCFFARTFCTTEILFFFFMLIKVFHFLDSPFWKKRREGSKPPVYVIKNSLRFNQAFFSTPPHSTLYTYPISAFTLHNNNKKNITRDSTSSTKYIQFLNIQIANYFNERKKNFTLSKNFYSLFFDNNNMRSIRYHTHTLSASLSFVVVISGVASPLSYLPALLYECKCGRGRL